MQQNSDNLDKSVFIIAYILVAFSGGIMGFCGGLMVGWLWWA